MHRHPSMPVQPEPFWTWERIGASVVYSVALAYGAALLVAYLVR